MPARGWWQGSRKGRIQKLLPDGFRKERKPDKSQGGTEGLLRETGSGCWAGLAWPQGRGWGRTGGPPAS